MQQGVIQHALRIGLPKIAFRTAWSYPAQRSDGKEPTEAPNAIMAGQRFRLDPSVDVASLGLTPIATAVARSAQKYGFIVTDRAGTLTISTESGQAATQATGTNPWTKLMGGTPAYLIMKNFPWSRLQALPVNYGQGLPVTPAETKIVSGPSPWFLGKAARFRLSSSLWTQDSSADSTATMRGVRTTRPPSRDSPQARISSRSVRWTETVSAMRPRQSAVSRFPLMTAGCA